MKARCRGCNSPFSASPSAVMISDPSYATARARQLLTRLPSRRRVHAPHWPWSQPFFGLVIPRRSLSASRSVVRVSTVRRLSAPSTRSVISASTILPFRSQPLCWPTGTLPVRRRTVQEGYSTLEPCLCAVVRTICAGRVNLVFAALGRLVGVRRPLFLARPDGCLGVGWVPRVLYAGGFDVLFRAFRGFLGVHRSSLFTHRPLLVLRSTAFSSRSVPPSDPTVTIRPLFRTKMV